MAEPVTVAEAKVQIGLLDDTSRDAMIGDYITAAREWVEERTGYVLVERSVEESHPSFACFFDLRWRPFDPDTVEIAYTDSDGAPQTVSALTINGSRVRPGFEAWWPTVRANTGVMITYDAGGDVPLRLKQAILLLVAHWFENRSTVVVGTISGDLPFAVEALCDQFMRPGL